MLKHLSTFAYIPLKKVQQLIQEISRNLIIE